MKKFLFLFSALALFAFTSVAQTEEMSLEETVVNEQAFVDSLAKAFHSQKKGPAVENGTLIFNASNGISLSIRNGSMMLSSPAKPFFDAGLTADEEGLYGEFFTVHEENNSLMIARSTAQTMDFQEISVEEIAQRLYQRVYSNDSPYTLTEEKGFMILTDGVLELKWNTKGFTISINTEVLHNAHVTNLKKIKGSVKGNWFIVKK